jgi:hypothetical protein
MRNPRWFAPGLAALLLAVPARAQDSALAAIPAQSPIVLHVRGIERTKDRLLTTVKNALPDLGQQLQAHIEMGLQQALEGRELRGLPAEGPVFFAFTEMPKPGGDVPAVALVFRVTDAAAFRKGILTEDERKTLKRDPAGFEEVMLRNHAAYVIDRGGYITITPSKDVAVQFTKPRPGLNGKLSPDLARKLLEADVSLYVDTAAVNKEYGDQIQGGRQILELVMQQGDTGVNKGTMAMARQVLGGAFQAFADSRAFLLAFEFRPEGFAVHGGVQVGPDSKTNEFLKTVSPSELNEVGSLPAGQMAYTALRLGPALGKVLQPLLLGAVADPDSEQGKAIRQALEQIAAAGPRALLQAQSLGGEGILVGQYADPAKAAQANLALFRALKEGVNFNSIIIKQAEVKPNAQKHRDFQLHHAQLVWDYEKMAEGQPGGKEVAEAMKKMLGEGTEIWFGTNGKVYVQVAAKDWAKAQSYLDAYLAGKTTVGQAPAFAAARKQMPAQGTMLALYDVPQSARAASEILGAVFKGMGLGNPGQAPAGGPGKPSFGGAIVTFQAGQASFDVWIPGAAVAEVRRQVEPLLRGMRGGN